MQQTIPAEEVKTVQTEHFLCPNCGGNLRYDIKRQLYCCESCGSPDEIIPLHEGIREYPLDGYHSREAQNVAFEGASCVFCQNCGAQILFGQYDTATVCPMCGSTQVDVKKQESGIPPEGIVPFRLDQKEAQEKFHAWIKKRWFAPNSLKKTYQEGRLTGLYIPFWTYDAKADGWFTGRGGRTRTYRDKDGHTHTTTDWYPVRGSVGQFFNDLQVCASEKSNSKYLNDVLPYDTVNDIKPYSPQYISGFQAEKYAWRGDACFRLAERMIKDALEAQARDSILAMGYDQAQVLEVQFSCSNVTYKHVLLPLWSAVFSHKGKLYQYLINGETGKVSGGRPYSAPKIVAAVLAAIAVLAGLYFLIESAGAYAAEYHPPAAQSQAQQVDLTEPGSPAEEILSRVSLSPLWDETKADV